MKYPQAVFSVRCLSSLLLLCATTGSAYASDSHLYVTGSLGSSTAMLGNSHPEINYSGFTDAYPVNGSHSTTGFAGVSSGYEFSGDGYKPTLALGIGVYGTPFSYTYHGQVTEAPIGGSSNTLYNYKYTINSVRLMAEAQASWLCGSFAPFVNVGVGPAWNFASGYTETAATSDGYVGSSPFQAHTNTNFAYQVGVGIGYVLHTANSSPTAAHDRLSLGYRYVDLGNVNFGTRGPDYPYSLNTGRLKTNDIYLSYTYFFNI